MRTLREIAEEKVWNPQYVEHYTRNFEQYRLKVERVLELGVFMGKGTRIWREYFLNAQIIGIDVEPGRCFEEERIKVHNGNLGDRQFLESVRDLYESFDIVVDDGSHWSTHMKNAWEVFYPVTNCCYCIEDLGTQHPGWSNKACQPNGYTALTMINEHIEQMMYPLYLEGKTFIEKLPCKNIDIGKWQIFYHK